MSGPRVEVSWEDQRNINLFNRLHVHCMELQAEIKDHKKRLEDLEDASNELILVDEEAVRYAMGSGLFVHLSVEEAEEKLQERTAAAQSDLKAAVDAVAEIQKEMEELKKTLYAKFGNTINLDP